MPSEPKKRFRGSCKELTFLSHAAHAKSLKILFNPTSLENHSQQNMYHKTKDSNTKVTTYQNEFEEAANLQALIIRAETNLGPHIMRRLSSSCSFKSIKKTGPQKVVNLTVKMIYWFLTTCELKLHHSQNKWRECQGAPDSPLFI